MPFKHYRISLKSGVTFLSIANDSETNNCVCQAMLASFAKALKLSPTPGTQLIFSA